MVVRWCRGKPRFFALSMGPGFRRGDGFLANTLNIVIPAQAGTHKPPPCTNNASKH